MDRLKHNLTEEQMNEISQNCHGYVGADLEMLVQEAGLCCVNRLIKEKNVINFNDARNLKIIKKIR